MKKIYTLILCITLILSIGTVPSMAQKENIDDRLKTVGVPEELIEIMPIEQKNNILENEMIFDSYKKVTYEEDVNKAYKEMGGIALSATIPSADMDFYISYYKLYPYNSSDKKIRVYVNYDWGKLPIFTLTDPFGVAWDNDIWRPVDDTAMNISYYDRQGLTNPTLSISDDVLAYSDSDGCGWNTDIKGFYQGAAVTDNYGWGSITLEAKDPGNSGTTQFHANYAHIHGVGSIGLSFSAINVSYSGGASADTRGVFETLTY